MFRHTKLGITILVLIIFLACIARASRPVGDIDGNFRVDINDLELLADQWLGDPNGSANINGDDRINMADFCLLANNWGKGTPVYISEFMANKGSSLSTEVEPVRHPGIWEEIKPDWIELHNVSDQTQNLDGWYLTDNKNNLTKWRVPSISIGSGQYKVICVSGKQQKYYSYNYPYFDGTYYHTNFELNRGGEYLALVRPDGVTVADEYAPEYPNQRGFVSYGYCSDTGGYGYFVDPTWGAANSSTCVTDIVADTKFSHDRGFYEDAFDVTISTTTLDATIRYTTDGSTPTETHGNIYSSPVHISTTTCLRAMAYKSGYLPTNVDTQTYIFLEDVLVQDGDGFPDTWGHFVFLGWGDFSDYWMVPSIVSLYDSTIRDDLKAIPTMSLVMSVDEWFNGYEWPDHGGIYANPQWEDIYDEWAERVVSVELFDPCGTLGEFQINAVVRICGGTSTQDWKTDKLSMRLKFQEPYGPTKLNYPIFGDEVADSFDTLILDARPNNSWLICSGKDGYGVQNIHAQYTRDQFVADLHNAMADGNYSPHGRKVHLYLNGLYWGLYWVHERPDHSSAASYFGGDKDDYDCLKHAPGTVVHGTNTNYGEMFGIVSSTPVSYETYQLIQQYLDLPDFIDYIQTNFYAGNHDWPDSPYGNWYATRNVIDPAGRWRYHSWDAEHVVEDVSRMCLMSCDITYGSPLDLHDKLSTNTEYRMLFADHAHKHLFNDGVLTPENAAAMYQVRLDEIDRAIVGESARWGDNRYWEFETIFTRDVNWVSERDRLLNTYFPYRTDNVIVELWYFGLYPDIDAPIFTPHGGWDMTDFTVTMTNPNSSGTIYYTTDGNDPRLPGGAVNSSSATAYGPAVSITETTNLKARVLDSGDWSALNEATYAVGPVADNLRITEIMYHPQDTNEPNDPNEEFIELMNIGTESINLNLVRFTRGIYFTFPSVTLDPNGYIIVVKNQSAFEAQYPGFTGVIAGEYTGSLANEGDRVRLEDANDQIIHFFRYEDGWYDITDGDGFSLTIRDACGIDPCDWGLKGSWGASTYLGGTPGEADTGPRVGDIVINEILAHSDVVSTDWIELYNTTDKTINIGGWFLSDSGKDEPNLMKYQIAQNRLVGPGYYTGFTEIQNFNNPSDPGCIIPFALSENGETLYLSSGIYGELTLTGFREERSFRASDPDVTFGLYTKSSLSAAAGDPIDFVAMSTSTPGTANSSPVIGPVVITEIMYKPADDDPELEYIKLENISGSPVTLQRYYDDEKIYVQWKFTDGIEYTFPPDTTIEPDDYIYVVYDEDDFSSAYQGVASSRIFGPFEDDDGERTKLSNSGEDIELSKPGDKDEQTGERYYILVDRVVYSDGTHPEPGFIDPWPTTPDGDGDSLHKDPNSAAYGNDVDSWVAGAPSPN